MDKLIIIYQLPHIPYFKFLKIKQYNKTQKKFLKIKELNSILYFLYNLMYFLMLQYMFLQYFNNLKKVKELPKQQTEHNMHILKTIFLPFFSYILLFPYFQDSKHLHRLNRLLYSPMKGKIDFQRKSKMLLNYI
ncbi:hypothetical protein IMG5_011610 [Ichthyophthirius multifiliis]|uniref:Transmembrane protein n=1 Tax=Ichthyophthirius multifiliis TaxID=5932 RepID=G0QK20_ICHMU|nr:hypothetical protein IMG5_011610 [Ichthyophthirius multifiliis]EGR34436.1 hypothetical protein IMG5_011610 [Ichthyophthirius multifiliis]|eukprot:XP_004039740.1 hypothetical protein IMG5_011610 [Ichthyophthirius multifiliis]